MSKTFSIHAIPFYKSIEQRYIKVLCLDRVPDTDSVLNQIVKHVKIGKVSSFKQGVDDDVSCSYIIMNPNKPTAYAQMDDVQLVFSWLMQHGFTIDTALTQLFLQGGGVRLKHPIVCFIHG